MRLILMTVAVLGAGSALAQTAPRTSGAGQISPGPTSNPSSSPGLSGTAGILSTSPTSAPPSSVPSTPPSGAPPDVIVQPK